VAEPVAMLVMVVLVLPVLSSMASPVPEEMVAVAEPVAVLMMVVLAELLDMPEMVAVAVSVAVLVMMVLASLLDMLEMVTVAEPVAVLVMSAAQAAEGETAKRAAARAQVRRPRLAAWCCLIFFLRWRSILALPIFFFAPVFRHGKMYVRAKK